MTALSWYHAALAGIGGVFLLNAWAYARRFCRDGASTALVLAAALKSGALGLALAMVWVAWAPPPDQGRGAEAEAGRLPVVVLQDFSASMELTSGQARREALAAEVLAHLRDRAAGNPGPKLDLQPFGFASRLVDAEAGADLDRSQTRIGPALAAALPRLQSGVLLVLSDGAFSDGLPSPFLLQAARSRGIRLGAVVCADPATPVKDLIVRALECPEKDPERIVAQLAGTGELPAEVKIELSVDGQPAEVRNWRPTAAASVAFAVPPLKQGWHEFAVRLEPLDGEVCTSNNLRRGIFRVESRDKGPKLLVLYGRPQRESSVLARWLRSRHGEQVEARSLLTPGPTRFTPASYRLLILADIADMLLPQDIRDALVAPKVPILFLDDGKLLPGLLAAGITGLPVQRTERSFSAEPRNLAVTPAAAAAIASLRDLGRQPLPVHILPEGVQLRAGGIPLLTLDGGDRRPLVVADSLDQPLRVVNLVAATWKWWQDPEPTVREGYELFWGGLIEWLLGAREERFDLDLTARRDTPSGEEIHLTVGERSPAAEPLTRVRVVVSDGAETREVDLAPAAAAAGGEGGRRYQGTASCPVAGQVLWCQAFGLRSGRQIESPRIPVLMDSASMELTQTSPSLAAMRAVAGGQDEWVSWYPDHERLLDRLLVAPEMPMPPVPHQRRHGLECLLAALATLCFAGEWFLERRAAANG